MPYGPDLVFELELRFTFEFELVFPPAFEFETRVLTLTLASPGVGVARGILGHSPALFAHVPFGHVTWLPSQRICSNPAAFTADPDSKDTLSAQPFLRYHS